MPFFRNGIKRLDFQKKSELPKSQRFIPWQKTSRLCYSIVTKSLHSLLVFAKEGVLLEFYEVKHCKPRKYRYIFVTFLGGLYHGGGQKKEWRYGRCKASHYFLTPQSLKAISYQFTMSDDFSRS
jgi:hypothetical protein